MSTSNQTNITAELIEKELFEIEISEKEIITVQLNTIDVIYKHIDTDILIENLIYNEIPTKLTATKFQTANNYLTGSLKVYFNGMKLHTVDITENSSNTFSLSIDTISTDLVEIEYIRN